MYKQHHSNIVTQVMQFPPGTKLKVTVDAKPGSTTAKYFGIGLVSLSNSIKLGTEYEKT